MILSVKSIFLPEILISSPTFTHKYSSVPVSENAIWFCASTVSTAKFVNIEGVSVPSVESANLKSTSK